MSEIETLKCVMELERKIDVMDRREHHHPIINLGAPTELTIAGGIITRTQSYHTVDTQGDAATDDLDTINGGVDGDLLIIEAANSTRDVVAKDMTGNLQLAGDFTMDHVADRLTLLYVSGYWFELCRSTNA